VSGKVLGVLLLRTNERRQAFTPREVDFLRTVAHATAVALRNVRLLEFERGLTEREKHARLLAEERAAELARYEGYFAHLTEGIAILDEHGNVLSLNPAGAEMLDVSPQEARGRPLQALAGPDGEWIAELLAEVGRGQVRRAVDVPVRTVTGRHLTLSLSGAPLHDRDGASILSFRDVTVQRALADELRQTKDFLERLIDASVDGIVAADLRGRILLWNKGAERVTGYPAAEVVGKLSVSHFYPPGQAREIMDRLRDASSADGHVRLQRAELVGKTGEVIPVDLSAALIRQGDRETATVGVFSDLRERLRVEEQLRAAEQKLALAEKAQVASELAGAAAHELNQPLTSILGFSELLFRRSTAGAQGREELEQILREVERMAGIVRKIGRIARYETMEYVGKRRIVDLEKSSKPPPPGGPIVIED
jgi:PAS domain S-box-containing protein